MDKKFISIIKIEYIFFIIISIFVYLMWSNIRQMDSNFNKIDKKWDSLDSKVKTYEVRVQQMDSITKTIFEDIASLEKYK